nr:protein C2-DOMAIN ABA-RELATED 4-like [Ipomoea trifida]GMC95017.1 protein C2-DOMAIN ABA-RELATED 4-like [Ipomoea batatas]GMC97054.1 protein C2-DOMAIN ABA-RELATED 4-like [Ipomoea batatas]GME21280.1 protein C2-DOMAIN ABA-RELATED 4-like [Ipomoea batatas]
MVSPYKSSLTSYNVNNNDHSLNFQPYISLCLSLSKAVTLHLRHTPDYNQHFLANMKGRSGVSMENLLGLLRIRIYRGVNLAIRDVLSSDPYVIVRMGKQKLKTSVVKRNVNPEWNEDLTLSISDPNLPITLQVYDKDRFSFDDKMGDAEFDITTFVEAVKMHFQNIPSGTIITKIKPSRVNCLAEESSIVWEDGKVVQNMVLRLRNVECGELELQLQWIDIPGCKGL